MSPEVLYQIGVRSGILDEKHRKALGYSGLWLFGFLILKQNREGKINYGRPLTYREISKGSGINAESLRRIFPRVVLKQDYFDAVRTRDGYKITGVKKQKKFLDQDSMREKKGIADGQPGQERTSPNRVSKLNSSERRKQALAETLQALRAV